MYVYVCVTMYIYNMKIWIYVYSIIYCICFLNVAFLKPGVIFQTWQVSQQLFEVNKAIKLENDLEQLFETARGAGPPKDGNPWGNPYAELSWRPKKAQSRQRNGGCVSHENNMKIEEAGITRYNWYI
jgi:hypothetical protein